MFTGIVTAIGQLRDLREAPNADRTLRIATPWPDTAAIPPGASVACAGCCLTVTATGSDWFEAQVSAETLSKTSIGGWTPGAPVNLERALRLGDELGGHLVSGHVDGLADLLDRREENGSLRLRWRAPGDLARFVAPKGSVTLDGVSLTVNEVSRDEFGVNVIPHTASHTTLGGLRPGDRAHIEIDMLARYVARLREAP